MHTGPQIIRSETILILALLLPYMPYHYIFLSKIPTLTSTHKCRIQCDTLLHPSFTDSFTIQLKETRQNLRFRKEVSRLPKNRVDFQKNRTNFLGVTGTEIYNHYFYLQTSRHSEKTGSTNDQILIFTISILNFNSIKPIIMEPNINEPFSFVRKSNDPLIAYHKILISKYFSPPII